MASLVNYSSESDSESEDSATVNEFGKRPRADTLPALPSVFKHGRPDDDPKKYQGRIRTVPHTEGNWPTLVYIEVKCGKDIEAVLENIDIPDVIVDCPDDVCHVSLSKCLYLKEFQFDTFKSQIAKGLASVKPFSLAFAAIAPLTNEVGTRSFCSLEVGYGYNELEKCMNIVDKVAERHRQPKFYQPPRFHASIAWSLKLSPIEKAISLIPAEIEESLRQTQVPVSHVYIKIGKKVEKIRLGVKP